MTSPAPSFDASSHSAVTLPSVSSATKDSSQIKILLWNLWLLPSLLTDRHSHTRATAISTLLNDYDIIVLNEGFTNKKALLSQTTHAHRYIPQCPRGRVVDSGLIFLSKHEIVKSDWERYDKVAGIDRFASKGIGFVTVKVKGLRQLQVFGTHMQAGASKSIQAARHAQATQAGKFVVKHKSAEQDRNVVVLAGDLNMGPRQDAGCKEFSVHYVDREDAKARSKAYEEMIALSRLVEVRCEQGWEYSRDICRFLVSGLKEGKEEAVAKYEEIETGPAGRRLSDTKPICLTVTIGSEEER